MSQHKAFEKAYLRIITGSSLSKKEVKDLFRFDIPKNWYANTDVRKAYLFWEAACVENKKRSG